MVEIAAASAVGPRTWTHVIDDDRSEGGVMSEVRAAQLDRPDDRMARVRKGRDTRGEGGRCHQLGVHSRFTRD